MEVGNDIGLSIDMLDADRLREWARLLLIHGADIGHWGSVPHVAGKMQIMATNIEKAVRDIGTMRQTLSRTDPPLSEGSTEPRLNAAVNLLREWCDQEGWTDASVNDHVNVCRDFIRNYDERLAAVSEGRTCPHCQLPPVLPEVCTPALHAAIEANIARDWSLFNAGYEHRNVSEGRTQEPPKRQAKRLRDRATMNILTMQDPEPDVTKPIVRQLLSALEVAERYIDSQRRDLVAEGTLSPAEKEARVFVNEHLPEEDELRRTLRAEKEPKR